MSLIQAVKTNDCYLYGSCLYAMADLFFSFYGQNYARYLTYFSLFLSNIEETHPGATELLNLGSIGVARSFTPGNLCAVDKTIEETFSCGMLSPTAQEHEEQEFLACYRITKRIDVGHAPHMNDQSM